jgi:hypothetical protein
MKLHLRTLAVACLVTAAAGIAAVSARAAAPTNTSPPTVTGTAQQGRTLTANHGTWSNDPSTFFYRWQRCAADGTGCGNIDNAARRTYVLRDADVDHTVRIVVTASNSDGQTSANSAVTDLVSSNVAPKNTAKPAIGGNPQVGEELTADHGLWTGGVRSFAYQWQRCDTAGNGCVDVTGATGSSYGVRALDSGHTMTVVVTATNLAGSTKATSDATRVVLAASSPPTTQPAATNHRPSIRILTVRFVGARVYVRLRVCDDSHRNVRIPQRDSKPGVLSYNRTFRTLVPPRNCAALSRTWLPAPRFRHGRYVITLWARDFAGLRSAPASRIFFR